MLSLNFDVEVKVFAEGPTTKYSGRCNLSGCANVIDYSLPGTPHKLIACFPEHGESYV